MANKKDKIIFGLVATAAVCYFTSLFLKKQQIKNKGHEEGVAAYKEGEYSIALSLLSMEDAQDLETLQMIADCHMQLGNAVNALKFVNKCINIAKEKRKDIIELVNKRHNIHNRLGMGREAFKDLFLVNLILDDKKHKEEANEFLKKICIKLTKTHKIQGMASCINYSDFFDTLFFLRNEQDPCVVFINSREFEKCYEFVKDSDLPLHKLVLGCLEYMNGSADAAFKCMNTLDSVYARILCKYINLKKLKNKDLEDLKKGLEIEEDPTVLFYMSKIFESMGDVAKQEEALLKCNEIYPNPCAVSAMAVMYIKQKNHAKASALLKRGTKEYPTNINLACVSLEYSLVLKDVDEAMKTMEVCEQLFPDDPRLYLFKYMISEVVESPDISFLQEGIKQDPKYFKLYVYYGNTCPSSEESTEAYRAALDSARTADEIFTAYQLLLVVEAQRELFHEFPELFKKYS